MLFFGFLGLSWLGSAFFYARFVRRAPLAPHWMDEKSEAEVIYLTEEQLNRKTISDEQVEKRKAA